MPKRVAKLKAKKNSNNKNLHLKIFNNYSKNFFVTKRMRKLSKELLDYNVNKEKLDVTCLLMIRQRDAAKILGVSTSTLSRNVDIPKPWPFRKIQKLITSMSIADQEEKSTFHFAIDEYLKRTFIKLSK